MPLGFVIFCWGGSTKQPNGWLEISPFYWVTAGAGELEGGEDTVGLSNGDAGAGEFDNGDDLSTDFFTT